MTRALNHAQAQGLMRDAARVSGRPVAEVSADLSQGGVLTGQGVLRRSGGRFVLRRPCTCLRAGVPELSCRQCRGTGQA
ncbi:hypothetical protein [Deinococcus multiflagellatus]|uniref:Transcriptional regulator n=1 Tax=Deinococcus multiflagellatus TaxID=1656887 RepID=A0ABW1ZSA6_9DEIO|nr:hypothetical protein [Deinococcus multiflagellatus]MBZ9715551.1 hypothetical protein [Deinococcus multiflagellatus]